MIFPKAYITFFCVWLCAVVAGAKEDEEIISVRFRVFSWPQQFSPYYQGPSRTGPDHGEEMGSVDKEEGTFSLYYLNSGMTPATVELQEGMFSDWYKYSGVPEFMLYAGERIGGEEAASPVAATLTLPRGVKEFLFVLFPLDGVRYKVAAVPYPFDGISNDDALVMNLSSSVVRCSLGGDVFELQPGASAVRTPKIIDNHLEAIVIAKQTDESRWRRELFRKYKRFKNKNTLFFIYPRTLEGPGLDLLRLGLD